jgi:ribosome maturation protein Sdo1
VWKNNRKFSCLSEKYIKLTTTRMKKIQEQPESVRFQHGRDEFFVLVNPTNYKRWKCGESLPLVEVLEGYEIFVYRGDVKGEPQRPTTEELKEVFLTTREEKIIEKILKAGHGHHMNERRSFQRSDISLRNEARTEANMLRQ